MFKKLKTKLGFKSKEQKDVDDIKIRLTRMQSCNMNQDVIDQICNIEIEGVSRLDRMDLAIIFVLTSTDNLRNDYAKIRHLIESAKKINDIEEIGLHKSAINITKALKAFANGEVKFKTKVKKL